MLNNIRNKVVIPLFRIIYFITNFNVYYMIVWGYVAFHARFKTWGGDLLKISIKRAWVTAVLIIMSPRMSLYSRNKCSYCTIVRCRVNHFCWPITVPLVDYEQHIWRRFYRTIERDIDHVQVEVIFMCVNLKRARIWIDVELVRRCVVVVCTVGRSSDRNIIVDVHLLALLTPIWKWLKVFSYG